MLKPEKSSQVSVLNILQRIIFPIYGAVTILVLLRIAILIGIFNLNLLMFIGATTLFIVILVLIMSPIIVIFLIDRTYASMSD